MTLKPEAGSGVCVEGRKGKRCDGSEALGILSHPNARARAREGIRRGRFILYAEGPVPPQRISCTGFFSSMK